MLGGWPQLSPVAALEPRVQPRIYERDRFAVTFWTYYETVSRDPLTTASRTGAVCGLDLDGVVAVTLNADDVLQAGSAFKIAIALEVCCQARAGHLDLDEHLRFNAERVAVSNAVSSRPPTSCSGLIPAGTHWRRAGCDGGCKRSKVDLASLILERPVVAWLGSLRAGYSIEELEGGAVEACEDGLEVNSTTGSGR